MHRNEGAWRFSYSISRVQELFPLALRDERAARRPDEMRDVPARRTAKDGVRRLVKARGADEGCAGRRLGKYAFTLMQGAEIGHKALIRDGKSTRGKVPGHLHRKRRGTADGKAVRRRASGQADILHADTAAHAARKAEQHTGRFRRLDEKDVDLIAEFLLESKADTARRAADAAGYINAQRVLFVDRDLLLSELRFEPARRRGIAEEEVAGIFIVNEVAHRVLRCAFSSLCDRIGVVRTVFEHCYALFAQKVLLPLLRVRAHVDRDLIAERRAEDADAQPQIACGADMQAVAREERAERLCRKDAVVVAPLNEPVRKRDILSVLQDLVAAAARL